jgi:hypothetical protein
VIWSKSDLPRIPNHWRYAGSRQSPLSGGPRLAVTPVNAILNYCFALLEAESRLAVSALGLDPGLGVGLHTDTANRDSLALDVLEPVRPWVETWVLDWIGSEPLRRSDFFETETGNCRLRSRLCAKLSDTASAWGKLVTPWAEYVARGLWTTAKSTGGRNLTPPTRLTQQRRTEGRGKVWRPKVQFSEADHLCRGCGKTIRRGRTDCAECAIGGATQRLANAARMGRVAAYSLESRAKHSASRRRHAQACSAWDSSSQPKWLTTKLFSEKIQPLLVHVSASAIAKQLGVSRWYAGRIREGYRPHPRHWEMLADLVSLSNA